MPTWIRDCAWVAVLLAAASYPTFGQNLKTDRPLRTGIYREDANAFFRELTSSVWTFRPPVREVSDEALSMTTLVFRRDGIFVWRDASPMDGRTKEDGRYWLSPTGPRNGLLHMTNGTSSFVKITNAGLVLGDRTYEPSKRDEDPGDARLQWIGLPLVKPSKTWKRLVRNSWLRSNDFNAFMVPEKLIFKRNGHFLAEYRRGQCRHGGTWGLVRGTLVVNHQENCDERDIDPRLESRCLPQAAPEWVEDMLRIQSASFYPSSSRRDRRVFFTHPYGISTLGHYDGALRAGKPTGITLVHSNQRYSDQRLLDFRVSMQPAVVERGSIRITDSKVVLFTKKFDDMAIARNAEYQHDFVITPTCEGLVQLVIEILTENEHQQWPHYYSFFVEVARNESASDRRNENRK